VTRVHGQRLPTLSYHVPPTYSTTRTAVCYLPTYYLCDANAGDVSPAVPRHTERFVLVRPGHVCPPVVRRVWAGVLRGGTFIGYYTPVGGVIR